MKITLNIPLTVDAVYLKLDVGVAFWEDTLVNGKPDTDCDESEKPPTVPCAEFIGEQDKFRRAYNWRWRPLINIKTGKIVNWKRGITASTDYWVGDRFLCDFLDVNKNVVCSYEGIVPSMMCTPRSDASRNCLCMEIDENGYINRWEEYFINN